MKRFISIFLIVLHFGSCADQAAEAADQYKKKNKELENRVIDCLEDESVAVQLYLEHVRDKTNKLRIDAQYEFLRMRGNLLLIASAFGHVDVVESLLCSGRHDVSEATYYGKTALFYAVENGHLKVAHLLLEYGADMYHKDRYSQTPLLLASQSSQFTRLFQMYETKKRKES